MKKWTKQLLEESGYEIENAQIESVRLTMADHGVLTSDVQFAKQESDFRW